MSLNQAVEMEEVLRQVLTVFEREHVVRPRASFR